MITANRRARATIDFFIPRRLAIRMALCFIGFIGIDFVYAPDVTDTQRSSRRSDRPSCSEGRVVLGHFAFVP